jgi:hypothetical protein
MLFWSIKITLLSFILIFLVHYLINFFKSTLTVPKIKDLVNTPNQKYENMFNVMSLSDKQHSNNNSNDSNSTDINNINNISISENSNNNNNKNQISYTEIDLLPKPDENSMKNELKSFLKKQMETTGNESYNLKSFSESSAYSNF